MKPRKPFATTDEDDRISELTEAIIEALCSESKSGKDRPFMFTALMSVFSHLAATLDPHERRDIFWQLRAKIPHYEENAERIANLTSEPLLSFSRQ